MTAFTQSTAPINPPLSSQPSTGSISERAMLASLNIKNWSPRKLDKQVTREVAQSKGVTVGAETVGRYTKNLIPQSDTLSAVQHIVSQARAEFYNLTLPWSQDGSRILSADAYLELQARLSTLEIEYRHAVKKFIAAYPALQQRAQTELARLYVADEYPDASALDAKFVWKFQVLPLPQASDFRVNLGDDLSAQMREDIAQEINSSVASAMQDAYQRLQTRVQYVMERLSDPDAIFQARLLEGLRDMCGTLRKLNLTGDANLEQALDDLEARVLVHSAETLRENPAVRGAAASSAAEIHARMAGFMGVKADQDVQA